tara:strand:+ start:4749 stop:6959 length:2211 start_codon:yes stop_codon:yes gene_type:complete
MDYFEYLKNNPSAVKRTVKDSTDIAYELNGYLYFSNGRKQNLETKVMSNYTPGDMDNSAFITKMEDVDYAGYNAIEYADGGLELYISFKSLLEWTNINLNMFSEGVELIKIDFDSDKPMFMYSTTISTNLQKCYVRNSYLATTKGTFENTQPPFRDIDKFEDGSKLETLKNKLNTLAARPDGEPGPYVPTSTEEGVPLGKYIYPTVGNINNIYLNAIYISEQLKKLSDNESNKVSIAKFLQEICNGVNKALGSINDLQVIGDVDGAQNILTIVDFQQVRIRGLSNVNERKQVTTINAQGLKSMVTSISAQSSITPDLATMISVGAQANGETLGQEAVAFQKLNAGLTDRVYPTKGISAEKLEEQKEATEEREEKAKAKFNENLRSYVTLINNQKPVPGDFFGPVSLKADANANIENIPVELYKYLLGQFTETNQTAAGFIPIKLDLTLYGISGIKIFQKFKITKDILPFSYDQDYEFTITGVSHAVDSARWSTSISSIMGLAEKELIKEEAFKVILTVEDREYNSSSSPQSGNPTSRDVFNGRRFPKYWSTKTQKANSAVLKKAKQSENGKLPASDLFTFKWKDPKTGRVVTKQTLKALEAPLKELFDKAYEDGITLTINGAYRSYANQLKVWKSNCKNAPGTGSCQAKPNKQQAAQPGTSNHGIGVAVDLGNINGSRIMPNYKAGRTDTRPEYKWMAINGPKYGFYRLSWLVSQKGNSTRDKNENWESHHWEYLG